MNALTVVLLIASLVILVGNTMVAIAFLRGQRNKASPTQGRDQDAMDELHRRVQALANRRK